MLHLLLALLACTAPDTDDSGLDYSTSKRTDGGTWAVEYTTNPPRIPLNEDFVLQLVVTPPTELVVNADASMPGQDLGMTVDPGMGSDSPGLWTASPMRFHIEGHWQVLVAVSAGAASERVTFDLDCCE